MRLKSSEVEKLIRVINGHLEQNAFELYLFGSRTDDQKKGGDIDLLLVTESFVKEKLLLKKGRMKSDLSATVGDQRVDLTISDTGEVKNDAFLKSVFPEAILLTKSDHR